MCFATCFLWPHISTSTSHQWVTLSSVRSIKNSNIVWEVTLTLMFEFQGGGEMSKLDFYEKYIRRGKTFKISGLPSMSMELKRPKKPQKEQVKNEQLRYGGKKAE